MDDHVHLKIAKQCLASAGFWPLQFDNKVIDFLYKAYFKLTISIYVIFVGSQFIQMYKVIGQGLEEISGLMGTQLLYTLGLVKCWVVAGTTCKNLVQKIRCTEENILKGDDGEVKDVYMQHVLHNHTANRIMAVLAGLCYILFCFTPVFTEMITPPTALYDVIDNGTKIYRPRPLPLDSWIPFDKYKYYKLSFAWTILAMTAISPYIVACNNFFFSVTIFAVGQIRILQHSLATLKETSGHSSCPSQKSTIAKELRKCVVYHHRIINFVEELSAAMRTFLLLDFAACAVQMGVIGFQAAVAEVSFQLLKMVIYLGTMLTQLFLFYWFGNEILLESKEVATAIWQSEWYAFDNSEKNALLIVIVRAQKPLRLSVGPLYHMSTETMMTVIRAGYTYAAIMRRLYS